MATHPTATPATAATGGPPRELRIISHSNLFYWWPVWVVGFLMGIISLLSGYELAAVPHGTIAVKLTEPARGNPGAWDPEKSNIDWDLKTTKTLETDRVILYPEKGDKDKITPQPPMVGVTNSKGPGVIFCTVLLVVMLITNIHLRGVWSFVVIVIIVSAITILSLLGTMDWILTRLSLLDVRISTGGYFMISTVLLVIWLVIFILFDQQTYMEFTPGQFRVKLEIGEGVTAYDTRGMTVHKVRSDFFRHWILGLGSGDLIVRTTGAQAHEFNLQNVLFISQKVKIIEDMIAAAGR
jgi:hypothetical protein